jgi:hypothetical protein
LKIDFLKVLLNIGFKPVMIPFRTNRCHTRRSSGVDYHSSGASGSGGSRKESEGSPGSIREAAREKAIEEALNRRGIRGGMGSFEDKIINGCGPYRYLRYWYGKTHKSVYLGRVE